MDSMHDSKLLATLLSDQRSDVKWHCCGDPKLDMHLNTYRSYGMYTSESIPFRPGSTHDEFWGSTARDVLPLIWTHPALEPAYPPSSASAPVWAACWRASKPMGFKCCPTVTPPTTPLLCAASGCLKSPALHHYFALVVHQSIGDFTRDIHTVRTITFIVYPTQVDLLQSTSI